MPYIDRTVFTSNDQSSGDVADPNLLEANDSHIADVVDSNYTEMNNLINEGKLSQLNIVNMKSNGAKGDGTTDDTNAIKELLNTTNTDYVLYAPNGMTFKITENIPELHNRTIIGTGAILFDSNTFHFGNEESNTNTLYVAPKETADDTNNMGVSSNYPITIQKAFDILEHYYNIYGTLIGKWKIEIATGTYTGTDTNVKVDGVITKKRLEVYGPSVSKGVQPTAVFDGEDLTNTYNHGMVFLHRMYVKVSDLFFKNFRSGTTIQSGGTRCGLVYTDFCNSYSYNVWAENCDWAGVFHQSGGRMYVESGKVNNCRQGILSQFNVQVSIGYNGEGLTDSEKTNATNCVEFGVFITDNCTGHIDYCVTDSNYDNIGLAYNCNANLKENKILNGTHSGVRCQLQSGFYDTNNTFSGNADDTLFFQNSTPLFYKGVDLKTSDYERETKDYNAVQVTSGSLELSSHTIPGDFLKGRGKQIRYENTGELSCVNDGDTATLSLKINGVEQWSFVNSTATGGYQGWFLETQIINYSQTNQIFVIKFISSLGSDVIKKQLADDITQNITITLDGVISGSAGIKKHVTENFLIGL